MGMLKSASQEDEGIHLQQLVAKATQVQSEMLSIFTVQ